MLIFEFFSGIGGMHLSLKESGFGGTVLPYDVNLNANLVYKQNFALEPNTLSLEYLKKSEYENICKKNCGKIVWLMSPPCQPFTSQGKQLDVRDERTNAFKNLVNTIIRKSTCSPDFIILENVKNFETSNACSLLLDVLRERNYSYLQFILSPHQFNIPNRRTRYYLIARGPNINKFKNSELNEKEIITKSEFFLNNSYQSSSLPSIKEFLNLDTNNITDDITPQHKDLYLNTIFPDISLLKKNFIPHYCFPSSDNSTCFTKSYGTLHKGSGSVLVLDENLRVENKETFYKQLDKIRFFSDKEILKFLCFPSNFIFPQFYSMRDRYKLLGNSVNVKVVSLLLKTLLKV